MILGSAFFLIAAAVIPPLILLYIIYRMDKIEREPVNLLSSLFIRGAIGMFPILILEVIGDRVIGIFSWNEMLYLFFAYFIIPGFIEEGVKYQVLVRRIWNDPNFNFTFDAIVYAVFVSLGFAAVENVMYVLTTGFSTAVVRAVFSIPGHAMFGVVMGAGLAKAKRLEVQGDLTAAESAKNRAWILAAVLHGFYDFLLVGFGAVFYVYFVGLVVYVVKLLKRSAREDGPIGNSYY